MAPKGSGTIRIYGLVEEGVVLSYCGGGFQDLTYVQDTAQCLRSLPVA